MLLIVNVCTYMCENQINELDPFVKKRIHFFQLVSSLFVMLLVVSKLFYKHIFDESPHELRIDCVQKTTRGKGLC